MSMQGSKRPRTGMGAATTALVQDASKSDFSSMVVNNSAITGVANEQIGSQWDWDDDDRDMPMDIQALLSEFGDFGDFFENDTLPFGEPPGTAESQALIFPAPDCGDVGSSPVGMMDVSDQMLLPGNFQSFENFDPPPPVAQEESLSKNHEVANNSLSSGLVNHTAASSTGEFDHIIKAEALLTFASEYGAVETPTSELSSSIFRSPYFPKSRKVESSNSSPNNYIYGATPPSSPCYDGSDEKTSMAMNSKPCPSDSKKYYTHVDTGKEQHDKRSFSVTEGTLEVAHFLLSMKTVLATEVECIMFQASMCRIRHTLLASSSLSPIGFSRLTGSTVLNHLPGDQSTMTDDISGKYEVKKKESIPVRIAGDFDGGVLDGHLNAPVGVWRSVGVPKVSKPSNSPSMEVSASLPHNSFHEEGILSFGKRQPLLELLDGMALLVQQATSSVDLALDGDCGDGPYGWLALQEQWRRGFSCGPFMVHAGCGGTLASCHSLDIAGVELVDPLSTNVHASSAISLLQSDIKTALKSAFNTLDGPLSVTDWCKGRNQSGDAGSAVSSAMDGAKVDETSQRRSNQEICNSDSEQQLCTRLRPTLFVLPLPAILVGYQDDWLKTSASSLQVWEKAPLEPYALQKPITYSVICPDIDPLTTAAADFFQQLGTVSLLHFATFASSTTSSVTATAEVGKAFKEAEALLNWKASLDNQNKSLLSSWVGDRPCINWVEITCDDLELGVTRLNLSSFGLKELAYTMENNEKCDIFSFGVLALEIIMGKHLGDLISSLSSSTFTTYDMLLKDVLDQRLSLPINRVAMEVLSIAKIAIACLHTIPQSRPTMQQVSQELSTQKPHFPNTLFTITLGEVVDLRGSTV
nr:isoform 2 of mediator of rna polymerase ii transcription subunit 13 [Quercus suber]